MERNTQGAENEHESTILRPESAPPRDGLQDDQESDEVFSEPTSERPAISNLSQLIKELVPPERAEINNQIDAALKQIIEIQQQVTRNTNAVKIIGNIKKQVSELDLKFTSLDRSVNSLSNSVKEESSKISGIERRLQVFSTEINDMKQLREVSNAQTQQSREDIISITGKLTSLTDEVSSIKESSKVADIMLDSLRGEIREQRKNIDLIRSRHITSSTISNQPMSVNRNQVPQVDGVTTIPTSNVPARNLTPDPCQTEDPGDNRPQTTPIDNRISGTVEVGNMGLGG